MPSQFHNILNDIASLIKRKNQDYGDSYDMLRNEYGELAFLIRLSDKLNRLKTIYNKKSQVKEESVEDTIKDIIGYCTLELAFLKNRREDRRED